MIRSFDANTPHENMIDLPVPTLKAEVKSHRILWAIETSYEWTVAVLYNKWQNTHMNVCLGILVPQCQILAHLLRSNWALLSPPGIVLPLALAHSSCHHCFSQSSVLYSAWLVRPLARRTSVSMCICSRTVSHALCIDVKASLAHRCRHWLSWFLSGCCFNHLKLQLISYRNNSGGPYLCATDYTGTCYLLMVLSVEHNTVTDRRALSTRKHILVNMRAKDLICSLTHRTGHSRTNVFFHNNIQTMYGPPMDGAATSIGLLV